MTGLIKGLEDTSDYNLMQATRQLQFDSYVSVFSMQIQWY